MLDWFGRRTRATVAALAWLSFLQVGDYTAAVTPGLAWEGWWLLGRPSATSPWSCEGAPVLGRLQAPPRASTRWT